MLPPLLDGLDLDVADGELVVLTGDEGASALLRVLAGLEVARAGTVQGEALLLDPPPGTDWRDADVAGDLADPAALARLGMRSPPEREMWMLSAGERQRVRLARVLAAPPQVALLLDEPLGGLDAAGVRALLGALRGRTCVVSTADPRAAAAADRVLVLRAGRLHPA